MSDRPPSLSSGPNGLLDRLPRPYPLITPLLLAILVMGSLLAPASPTASARSSTHVSRLPALDRGAPGEGKAAVMLPAVDGDSLADTEHPDTLAATVPNTVTLRGPTSGRLKDLTYDRQNPSIVRALFDDGIFRFGTGLVESTDGGATWRIPFKKEDYGRQFYHHIAIHPTNSDILYADNFLSLDRGATWLTADSGMTNPPQDLVVAPSNPDVLYARDGDILYKSTDAGAAWQTIPKPAAAYHIADIVVDPADADTLYIQMDPISCPRRFAIDDPTTPWCLSITTDSGATWTDLTPLIRSDEEAHYYARPTSLVVQPAATAGDPSQILIASAGDSYPRYDSETGEVTYVPYGGVFRSRNQGQTWQRISTGLPRAMDPSDATHFTDYLKLTGAEPVRGAIVDTSTLYVVASDMITLTGVSAGYYRPAHRLFVSRNAGSSWQQVDPAPNRPHLFQQIRDMVVRAGRSVATAQALVNVEQRTYTFDTVADFASGIFRTTDNGTTWHRSDEGLSNQEFAWIVHGPDGLYASAPYVGLIKSTDGGVTWSFLSAFLQENSFDVNSIVHDPTDPRTLYIGTNTGTPSAGIYVSTDGGVTWRTRNLGIGNNPATMLAIAPTSPKILFAARDTALMRSTDGGGSWRPVSGLTSVDSMWVHPTNPLTIYARGTLNSIGGMLKSTDGGVTWRNLGEAYTFFAIDPNNPERLYGSTEPGAHLHNTIINVSNDGGATWEPLPGYNDGSGRVLHAVLPTNPTTLISTIREASGLAFISARTDYSTDGGDTWIAMGDFAPLSRILPGPVVDNTATFYLAGVTWKFGRSTPRNFLIMENRPGLWGYTFGGPPSPPPPPPIVEWSAGAYRIAERGGTATLTVTLSAAPVTDARIDYAVTGGTATNGVDFTGGNGTLVFAPGQRTATVTVDIIADSNAEPDETVEIELSNPYRLALGSTILATLTIVDGGPPPIVQFGTPNTSVREDLGPARLQVSLSATPTLPVTVDYVTVNGTAEASQDYVFTYGTLMFAVGERTKTIEVPIVNDQQAELDETLTVQLSNPTNALLGPISEATVTILDSSGQPLRIFLPLIRGGVTTSPPPPPPGKNAMVNLSVSGIPGGATRVRFIGSAPDLDTPITAEAIPVGGAATARLTVPSGTGRLFQADVLQGETLLARVATMQGLEPEEIAAVDLRVPLTPPAITCDNPALSHTQAAPGTIIKVTGVTLPPDATPIMRVSDHPAPTMVDKNGRLSFGMPLLPAGTRATLSLIIGNSIATCGLPPIVATALPPAPGESVRVFKEIAGLFNDLAILTQNPAGNPTDVSLALRPFRDHVLAEATRLAVTHTTTLDSVVARTGALAQLEAARATLRLTYIPPPSVVRLARPANTITDAQAVLTDQQAVQAFQNFMNSEEYAKVKAGLFVALGVISTLGGPVGAIFSAVVAILYTVSEKIADVLHRTMYLLSGIQATPPAQTSLPARGTATPWAGGTISVYRPQTELTYTEILVVITQVLISAMGPVIGKYAIDKATEVINTVILELINQSLAVLVTRIGFEKSPVAVRWGEDRKEQLPLGDLARVTVEPAAIAAVGAGNPGYIQPCSQGSTRVTVESDERLAWVEAANWPGPGPYPSHRDRFTLNITAPQRPGLSTPTTLPAVTCPGYKMVAGGGNHTIAVMANGTGTTSLWTWGSNTDGQLGDGAVGSTRSVPGRLTTSLPIASISAGLDHTLAVDASGALWAWGHNVHGELGDGTYSNRAAPVMIMQNIAMASAGEHFSVVLDRNGSVWSWGHNGFGQLGQGVVSRNVRSPVKIPGLTGIVAVSAGRTHALALDSTGAIWAWGNDDFGQLGNGFFAGSTAAPTRLITIPDFKAIAAGGLHSLAITTKGDVFVWGSNRHGQLGRGSVNVPLPVRLELSGFAAIAAGYNHSLALKSDGKVYAWGSNSTGQLGVPGMPNSSYPVQIQGLSHITSINAGAYFSLAIDAAGDGWAWGDNASGQLGDRTRSNRQEPVRIAVTP
jgi:alpha-tubulin suppressor-like RCC1 family protein